MNRSNANPVASPCVMVIFGATGDLTKRKLIPALSNLAATICFPSNSRSLGSPETTSPRKVSARLSPKKFPNIPQAGLTLRSGPGSPSASITSKATSRIPMPTNVFRSR